MTPEPSYVAASGSPLLADPDLYGAIATQTDDRELLHLCLIPVRSGRAFEAPAGSVVRFSIVEGPQVLDVNLWCRWDVRERFWAARTRQFYGAHVTTGASAVVEPALPAPTCHDRRRHGDLRARRGRSRMPRSARNPMLSVRQPVAERHELRLSLPLQPRARDPAVRPHRVRRTRRHQRLPGDRADARRRALLHEGLSGARVGDVFEIFAEVDLLVAASTCPGEICRCLCGVLMPEPSRSATPSSPKCSAFRIASSEDGVHRRGRPTRVYTASSPTQPAASPRRR